MKKLLSLLLVLVLVLALCANVFAEGEVEGETDTGSQTAGDPIYPPETGSITIVNAAIGIRYVVYKVFDASFDGENIAYSITEDETNASAIAILAGENSPFNLDEIGASGIYNVTLKADKNVQDISAFFTANEANLAFLCVGGQDASATTLVFNDLPFGYYFVARDQATAVSVDNVTPHAVIFDKNQKPGLDSKLVRDGEEWVTTNSASMGETIQFKLEATLPLFDGDKLVTEYTISDGLDRALTYIDGTLVIKYTDKPEQLFTDYTVKYEEATEENPENGGNSLTITIPVDGKTWDPMTKLTIIYDALVSEEAEYIVKNRARASWKTVTPDPEDPTVPKEGETPTADGLSTEHFTATYLAAIQIQKVDGKGNNMEGVSFKLTGDRVYQTRVVTGKTFEQVNEGGHYYKLKSGTFTTKAPSENTMQYYISTVADYILADVATEVQTKTESVDVTAEAASDGTILFSGLGAGTYTLTEVVTPTGYNSIDPITFIISYDAVMGVNDEKFSISGVTPIDIKDSTITIKVVNEAGVELPSTGGIGTTIFYVVGGLLVFAAVVLLITKKRLSAQA